MAELNATLMARRRYLTMAISSQLEEAGFATAERDALETLTEMMQSFLVELGQSARNYCELAGRTQPVIGDVVVSLINMGISIRGLEAFAKREGRHMLPQPQQAQAQKQQSILQAGQKIPHPSYIPNHLPQFPDPHAYIRTPTHKQPVTEYEVIREKAAQQQRDVERALTKFLAKTSEIDTLFENEENPMFPLIACKPSFPPYLQALNPSDQIFDFEELEYYYLVANRKEDPTETKEEADADDDDDEDGESPKKEEKRSQQENKQEIEEASSPSAGKNDSGAGGNSTGVNVPAPIDNPYLRAATIPRKVKHELR